MDVLVRIKRCAISGRLRATDKAITEMYADGLTIEDVKECLAFASGIYKTLRSRNPRTGRPEHLYVIISANLSGFPIYTKGKFEKTGDTETFYVLVSSKHSL